MSFHFVINFGFDGFNCANAALIDEFVVDKYVYMRIEMGLANLVVGTEMGGVSCSDWNSKLCEPFTLLLCSIFNFLIWPPRAIQPIFFSFAYLSFHPTDKKELFI